jgi:ArsR family transcriptional regulator, arsenate/arsenite/antimonite-responsive transcriptional repressor
MTATSLLDTIPVRRKNEPCCAAVAEPSMSEARTATLATQLKALADPTRLRMLDLLVQQPEPLCVCDITERFAQNQPTISHHLRILREGGLIDTEKRGIWSHYWATDAGRAALSAVAAIA